MFSPGGESNGIRSSAVDPFWPLGTTTRLTPLYITPQPSLTHPRPYLSPSKWRDSYNSAQVQTRGRETKRPFERKQGRSCRTFEPSSPLISTFPPWLPIHELWPLDVWFKRLQADWVLLYSAALKKLISELPSMSEQELAAAGELGTSATPHLLNPPERLRRFPWYSLFAVSIDSVCPICFLPFSAILAEHEMAAAMDSPARPIEELGITKLSKTCGHIFCRKE